MINRIKIKFQLIMILLFTILSCSSFQETPSQLATVIEKSTGETVIPRNANSIYIYPVANSTSRQDIDDKLILNLRNKMLLEGRLAIVPDIKSAELSLEITVNKYLIEPIEYRDIGRPVRMRLKIMISVKLYDLKREKIIFNDPLMQSYKVYSDVLPPVETEEQVLDSVIVNLTDRIMEKTKTGWDTKYKFPEEIN